MRKNSWNILTYSSFPGEPQDGNNPTEDYVLVSQDARRQELQFDTTRCSSFLEELIFKQLQVSCVLASLEDYWKETFERTRVSSFPID